MRADLQNRIAPPTPVNAPSGGQATAAIPAKDSNDSEAIDFGSLMAHSNSDAVAKRQAQKQGKGLANTSDQAFFDNLRKQTGQRPAPKNTLDKDDFLKLFVAQLQNQDPLKPKEDAEMAAQLAQFNGLEQMVNVNTKLEELNKTQKLGQAINLISFVGKDITIGDGRSLLKGGAPEGLSVKSTVPLNSLTLEVRDETGKVVANGSMNQVAAGESDVKQVFRDKEGKALKDGTYFVSAKGMGQNGEPITVDLSTTTKVTGIEIDGDGRFHTALGNVAQTDVKAVGMDGFKDGDKNAKAADPLQSRLSAQTAGLPPELQAALPGMLAQASGEAPIESQQPAPLNTPTTPSDVDETSALDAQVQPEPTLGQPMGDQTIADQGIPDQKVK